MYAYSLFYKDAGNVNAQRWCEIRMKDVIDAMKNKRLKQKQEASGNYEQEKTSSNYH